MGTPFCFGECPRFGRNARRVIFCTERGEKGTGIASVCFSFSAFFYYFTINILRLSREYWKICAKKGACKTGAFQKFLFYAGDYSSSSCTSIASNCSITSWAKR